MGQIENKKTGRQKMCRQDENYKKCLVLERDGGEKTKGKEEE